MMSFCASILYLIAAILGLWSTSLIWRIVQTRVNNRRARAEGRPAGVQVISPARIRLGVVAACVALPAGVAAAVIGEWVVSGMESDKFDAWTLGPRAGMWLMLLLAGGAIIGGWWFDPAHGRRRCPKCWYDMAAVPGTLCPECGHSPKNERGFLRTRRAPGLMIVAVLLLAGAYAAQVSPKIRREGPLSMVPTTVLIAGFAWLPDSWLDSPNSGDLAWRLSYEDVPEWQHDLLAWRVQRMLEHGTAYSDIKRALNFRRGEKMSFPIGDDGLIALIDTACSDSKDSGDAQRALWYEWGDGTPRLSPRVREAGIRAIKRGLTSDSEQRIAAASALSTQVDVDESVVPLLQSLVVRPDCRWCRNLALPALAVHADKFPAAWQTLLDLMRDPDIGVRSTAIALSSNARGHRDEAIEIAFGALDDPSDTVVRCAASALAAMRPDPARTCAKFEAVLASRPSLEPTLTRWLVHGNCSIDVCLAHVRHLLQSSNPREQELGAEYAGMLGQGATSLLPLLREFAKYEGLPDRRKEIADWAIPAIERALPPDQNGSIDGYPFQNPSR